MILDVFGTVNGAVGSVMLEHLVGWILLESASSTQTGNALIYLKEVRCQKISLFERPFDWDRALTDTS